MSAPNSRPKHSGRTVEQDVGITVRGRGVRLPADTFASWAVREVAVEIAAATGAPYVDVIGDVIDAYLDALDEQAAEAAA